MDAIQGKRGRLMKRNWKMHCGESKVNRLVDVKELGRDGKKKKKSEVRVNAKKKWAHDGEGKQMG